MDKLMDRQALLQDKIDALGAWEIDTKLEIAMDALRTPDADTPIKNLSGGNVVAWLCAAFTSAT
jgi:ATPase subunit of ABC transporter with duplicated ATPase domains